MYLPSVWDNGRWNSTGTPPAYAYCAMFRTLKTPLKKLTNEKLIVVDSATALWILQMAHFQAAHRKEKRLVVMDNFYTRHTLAVALAWLTDGCVRILGTVKLNLVDSINRVHIKETLI